MPRQFYTVSEYASRRSVGYLLRRAAKLITGRIEALFLRQDITFVQWVILMHLREGLSSTSAELSQHLCHDSGALTRVIDQMEERGLIRRRRNTKDRRIVDLELTADGRKTIGRHLPNVLGLYNKLLVDFTPKEIETLLNLLTRLIAVLSEPAED